MADSLPKPAGTAGAAPAWYYQDNGFSSAETMRRLHEPLVTLARKTLAGQPGNVLDLGCGNGALLAKICASDTSLVPFGIEISPARLQHAHELLPEHAGNFLTGDMFAPEVWAAGRRYALAILMAGRLLEVPRPRAQALVDALRAWCDEALVYAYPDWANEPFERLLERVGLRLQGPAAGRTGLLALR